MNDLCHRSEGHLRLSKLVAIAATWAMLITTAAAGGVAWAAPNHGNSQNAHLCQHGGWMSLQGSDGSQFSNEGACVSYGAHGGTIVPIPPAIAVSFSPTFDPDYCNVHLTLTHFQASTTYPTTYAIAGFGSYAGPSITTDAAGAFSGNIFSFFNQDRQISFTIGGVTTPFENISC